MRTLIAVIMACAALLANAQSRTEGAAKAKAAASKPAAASAGATSLEPDKGCTTRPKSDWLPLDEMALLARHRGYKFERVKISYDTCYEIYGSNKDGDLVEAYFDPSNARLVRQNVVVLPKK